MIQVSVSLKTFLLGSRYGRCTRLYLKQEKTCRIRPAEIESRSTFKSRHDIVQMCEETLTGKVCTSHRRNTNHHQNHTMTTSRIAQNYTLRASCTGDLKWFRQHQDAFRAILDTKGWSATAEFCMSQYPQQGPTVGKADVLRRVPNLYSRCDIYLEPKPTSSQPFDSNWLLLVFVNQWTRDWKGKWCSFTTEGTILSQLTAGSQLAFLAQVFKEKKVPVFRHQYMRSWTYASMLWIKSTQIKGNKKNQFSKQFCVSLGIKSVIHNRKGV